MNLSASYARMTCANLMFEKLLSGSSIMLTMIFECYLSIPQVWLEVLIVQHLS